MHTTKNVSGDTCHYYRWPPIGPNNNWDHQTPVISGEINVPYAVDNHDTNILIQPVQIQGKPIKDTFFTSLRDMAWAAACCKTTSLALEMFAQHRPLWGCISAFASYTLWKLPTGFCLEQTYGQLDFISRRIAKLGAILATSVPLMTYAITGINPLPFIEIGLSVNAFALAWLNRYSSKIRELLAPDTNRAIEYEIELGGWRSAYIREIEKKFPHDVAKQCKAFNAVIGAATYIGKIQQAEVIEEPSPNISELH